MPPYPGFIGPSYVSQSPISDCEDLINWYVEVMESEGAKNRMALYPTPGLSEVASSSLSPVRAMFAQNGRCFVVIGYGFFELESNWVLTQRGTITADTNPATICSSGVAGNELFITSGGSGYIYDLTADTLSSAIAGLSVSMGAYLDGYFIALDTTNQRVRISAYLDGTTWDATQYRVRSLAGDNWVSMTVVHREIWLFGNQTYEIWYNAGTSPFPFAPIQGQAYNQGNYAPYSMSQVGESVAWLSANSQGQGVVMLSDQYAPRRISNHAVEFSIQAFARAGTDVTDATAFTYQEDGHIFYCLSFDTANITWAYDHTASTMLGYPVWHKRGTWATDALAHPARFDAWAPKFYCNAFGYNLVGDRSSGTVYKMGINLYSDRDSLAIRRVRRAPHVNQDKRVLVYSEFELDLETGVGLSSGQGSDPTVMMRYSDDGGRSWSNEMWASAGAIGVYSTRVQFTQLGSARDRVFEVAVSDPVPWRITNAYLRHRIGNPRRRS